jgi:hypothetical protein
MAKVSANWSRDNLNFSFMADIADMDHNLVFGPPDEDRNWMEVPTIDLSSESFAPGLSS